VRLVALDDLDRPSSGVSDGFSHPGSLIAGIGKDPVDEGKQRPGRLQHKAPAVAVLDVGGMNYDAQEQAERVNQDVALAPENLLARIVTLRVEAGPPFGAPLALCESMMAAVGLASRPSCSRTAS